MATKKSSGELVEDLYGLAEVLRDRAVAETRRDVAAALKEEFLEGSGSRSPDDCIIDALTDRELKARFDDEGVSDDFRAGLLFAIRCTADPKWEL